MAEKQRKRAPIIATSYTKRKTGEKNDKGQNKWERLDKVKRNSGFDSFAKLKQNVYEKSVANKDYFVNYSPRRLKSVTKVMSDGTKIVTYFGRENNKEKK